MASWVSTTPFGVPVVPLVTTTSASPASVGRPPASDVSSVAASMTLLGRIASNSADRARRGSR